MAALTLVILICAVLAWSVLGQVDVVSSAPGRIVPTSGSKVVQPLETATVTAIHVHDGVAVHKGEVLVELEPTDPLSDRARLAGELSAARLEAARLQAVALGARFVAPAGSDPQAAAIAAREARAEIADRQAKLDGLSQEILQHRAALEEVKGEVDRLTVLGPLAEQRSKIYQQLADSGYGSSLQMIEAQEKLQDNAKSLEVQRRRIPELQAQIDGAQHARAQAEADASKTALAALADIQVKAASLSEELSKASERAKDRTLVAPVDGEVQELAIHTVGGVVEPGQTLMRIAPAKDPVEVEARLSNQDVGFVRVGMPAEIKIQTFPFTRYGLVHGVVLSVSRDAVTDPKAAEPVQGAPPADNDLRYLMRVRLDRTSMVIDGKPTALTAGMMVTAEVKTGRRRVIDYVLSPLSKATQEAGRER
jgi:hemolysin D